MLAPFKAEEPGQLEEPALFNGIQFQQGDVAAMYEFNSYRLTWRYLFRESENLKMKIGFTGLVRDADVALEQSGVRTNYDNIGFVPLLNFHADYRVNDNLNLIFDFNGLAGGPGRLLEGDLRLNYYLSEGAHIGTGFRVLEGGADVDDVYNFAALYTGYVAFGYNF